MHSEKEPLLISKSKLELTPVERYLRECGKEPGQYVFVAEHDKKIVGIIRCEIQDAPDIYVEEKQLFIDDLSVVPGFRHKGVATRLINQCLEIAEIKNIKLVTSKIYAFNKKAADLFEKIGFKRDYSFYSLKLDKEQ